MQLYSSDISPYASRCRIQIHHKKLDVDIVPPPGGMRSAQVLEQNPAGRIPVLVIGSRSIGESWAIMEFLEARFPDPAMLPLDEFLVARQREIVRFTDIYLASAMFPMFLALRGAASADDVAKALSNLASQFQVFEQFIQRKETAARPGPLDLADAALVPIVWYGRILMQHFGKTDCLAPLAATRTWWNRVGEQPAVTRVLGELEAGLRAVVPALF